jgi:hypothetical protein
VVNYLDEKQKSKYSTPKGGDELSDLPLNQEVKPDSTHQSFSQKISARYHKPNDYVDHKDDFQNVDSKSAMLRNSMDENISRGSYNLHLKSRPLSSLVN